MICLKIYNFPFERFTKVLISVTLKMLPMLIFKQFGDLLPQFTEVRPLVHITRPAFLIIIIIIVMMIKFG